MKNTIWQKKIPTLLGIVLITIGIGLTSYLAKQGIFFIIKAGPGHTPKELKITNLTDSSFTASFFTDDEVVGLISLGETQELGTIFRDDRDQESGGINAYKIHYITVRNLKPETSYYFSIKSGEDTFLQEGVPYVVKTGSVITNPPPNQVPATGKTILPEGSVPKEAIVFLNSSGSQEISTLIKSDGSYVLPLNSIRDGAGLNYFLFTENSKINLTAVGDTYVSSAILSSSQINPIPTITLSKNYDFTIDPNPIQSTESAGIFPKLEKKISDNSTPLINIPADKDEFVDQQPLFNGTALPNEKVKIVINSSEIIEAETSADSLGNWQYRPDTPLSPGEHNIAIITKDSMGFLRTITRTFFVFPQGNQVAEAATPSATTTTLPKATTTTTTTSVPKPTEVIIVPTKIPIPSPTIAPPGNPTIVGLSIASIGIMIIGIILLVLSRGTISIP
ncbi:hypothetical protein KKG52_03465 [Patescibacteria group bacterium]|nr:hypothetical protein [Patescibacteria group bacterium]